MIKNQTKTTGDFPCGSAGKKPDEDNKPKLQFSHFYEYKGKNP